MWHAYNSIMPHLHSLLLDAKAETQQVIIS